VANNINKLSKTQVDRLGDRLRKGAVSESDLQILDAYRRTFSDAYDRVVRAIRDETQLEPTGRPAKSTTSITDKLCRESIRLIQIQDIAGCRLVVPDIAEQDKLVERLVYLFDKVDVVDRRENPSHGYRAVHVVVTLEDKLIEIQVRTSLQHLWAELSEKLSDTLDPAIKYGGGEQAVQSGLLGLSEALAEFELSEQKLTAALADAPVDEVLPDDLKIRMVTVREQVRTARRQAVESLQRIITQILSYGEGKHALPN
jgi:ppGpp synthetase/RelA/SpoT-type nucleotidyltranferase